RTAVPCPPMVERSHLMVLTPEERSLIERIRSAKSEVQKDEHVSVYVYTGSKKNADTLGQLTDLMSRLNPVAEDLRIEGFLVPIPMNDEYAASILKQSVIASVH